MILRDSINHLIPTRNNTLTTWKGDCLLLAEVMHALQILLCGLDWWTQKSAQCGSGLMLRTSMYFCSRHPAKYPPLKQLGLWLLHWQGHILHRLGSLS